MNLKSFASKIRFLLFLDPFGNHFGPFLDPFGPFLGTLEYTLGNFDSKSLHLHNYFDYHICLSFRSSGFRHKNFLSLKSPWNHPLTPEVNPRG